MIQYAALSHTSYKKDRRNSEPLKKISDKNYVLYFPLHAVVLYPKYNSLIIKIPDFDASFADFHSLTKGNCTFSII